VGFLFSTMQSSTERFKNIKKIGGRTHWSQDFYHYLLLLTWPRFFLLFVAFFLVFNSFFGAVYWLLPLALSGTDNSYFQAFLFSVQTFTTVGYGNFAPSTSAAHVTMVTESILTIFFSAALTGLVFAKFSRPSAKVIFSNNVLFNSFDGQRVMMMRLGNLRDNLIADAKISMVVLKSIVTQEGLTIRRQIDLKLQRDTSLFFGLSWLVIHVIDKDSPFFGLKQEDFVQQNIEIGVSLVGNDSTFSQTVLSNCVYSASDVLFDRYFDDIIESANNRVVRINYLRFHDLKPLSNEQK